MAVAELFDERVAMHEVGGSLKRGVAVAGNTAQDSLPKRTRVDQDEEAFSTQALRQLALLPPELQDAVIRHLPLADILVWQRVSKNFRHRIEAAALRERALCRSLGNAFPREVLTRDNYSHLLQPWLAGFSANPLGEDWPGAVFRPHVLWAAVTRTLCNTQQLTLVKQARFQLPGVRVNSARFSPSGKFLIIKVPPAWDLGRLPVHVFAWDGSRWGQGTSFAGARGVLSICFTVNEKRLAVADEKTQIHLWERLDTAHWQRTVRLTFYCQTHCARMDLLFSPDGRSLVMQGSHGWLHIWREDDQQQWPDPGQFASGFLCPIRGPVFSPDGRWLLVYSRFEQFTLFTLNREGDWLPYTSLAFREQANPARAFFRSDSQCLALLVPDSFLSLWQLQEGHWSERVVLRHPYGMAHAWFSPDGQNIVTRCSRSGALLWAQDAGGVWRPVQTLNRAAAGLSNVTEVHFDPASGWLIAADQFDPDNQGSSTGELWARDGSGQWKACPGSPLVAAHGLVVASTGQHLAWLDLRRPPADARVHDRLRLLEWKKGALMTKAQYPLLSVRPHQIAMDPFCCHLAVICSRAPVVELLRVQQASPLALPGRPDEEAAQE